MSAIDTLIAAATAAKADYLAQILASPASVALGVAAIGKVVVGDDTASADTIAAAVNKGGDELALQMQQAEQHCLVRTRQADTSWMTAFPAGRILTQLDNDDTAGARQRQIELHDNTNQTLAYWVTGGFFALIVFVMVSTHCDLVTGSAQNLLFTLLGVVATGWANIIGYYFGSSAGSQQKSGTIGAALHQSIRQNAP